MGPGPLRSRHAPHILPGLSRSARELPRRVPFATLFLKLVSTRFCFFLLKSLNGRKLGTRLGEEGAEVRAAVEGASRAVAGTLALLGGGRRVAGGRV